MRFQVISAIALVALFVSSVNCGCDRSGEEKPSNDGEVTQFFKNLGCDIKKGAEKVSDSAKPYIDDIKKGAEKVSESAKPYIDDLGSRAKKLGGSVVDRFNDLKEKISGSSDNATEFPDIFTHSPATAENSPIIEGSTSSPPLSSSESTSRTPTTSGPGSDSASSVIPSIDDRLLLDIDEQRCPENTKNDGRGHCRSIG